uniref:Uncharacterized protein n=1 Tax=Arundo donax TaxID=35708 RepID=A0A0A9EMT4_ARUDO
MPPAASSRARRTPASAPAAVPPTTPPPGRTPAREAPPPPSLRALKPRFPRRRGDGEIGQVAISSRSRRSRDESPLRFGAGDEGDWCV